MTMLSVRSPHDHAHMMSGSNNDKQDVTNIIVLAGCWNVRIAISKSNVRQQEKDPTALAESCYNSYPVYLVYRIHIPNCSLQAGSFVSCPPCVVPKRTSSYYSHKTTSFRPSLLAQSIKRMNGSVFKTDQKNTWRESLSGISRTITSVQASRFFYYFYYYCW